MLKDEPVYEGDFREGELNGYGEGIRDPDVSAVIILTFDITTHLIIISYDNVSPTKKNVTLTINLNGKK